ncbi:hypothetical protein L1987_44831 [Smallanthus sonchifolius]|uniref:Uncharacterized protein n=1 Tax=Smallanthus sonchifolius TaxID=185202 RepID=A0ACB9GQJ4_9ASTR|nr:hypothetical protein L1987_44831 [Smallanthus sonchifolius]
MPHDAGIARVSCVPTNPFIYSHSQATLLPTTPLNIPLFSTVKSPSIITTYLNQRLLFGSLYLHRSWCFSGLNPKLVAMGKSPGRWIKALIFGKKSSRSKYPKPNDEKRDVKEAPVSLNQRTEENLHPDDSQHNVCISATTELNESDRNREEQAAIDLQAALRGCLARRTFQTLKGIIRLQALIRGHLVRRQAISTLYCMFQIVKFQALVRGRKIRNSNTEIQVQKRCNPLKRLTLFSVGVNTSMQILKLSSNGFAQKILASSHTPMPLHFHYDSNEANSVLSWLDRWSTSRCWHLLPKPKTGEPSKPHKPHARRPSVTNVENIASEFDKPIRKLNRGSSDKPVNCIEENPEVVLERVKRNLRKVNSSVLQSTNDGVQKIISEPESLSVNEVERVMIKKDEKEDENVIERKKWRRVVCVPVKQKLLVEDDEPSQIKRPVPSYMAATVSAKAKLRGQEVSENPDTLTQRYSMPSLTNDKISVSPMAKTTAKLMNGRSLQLSRDGNGNLSRISDILF